MIRTFEKWATWLPSRYVVFGMVSLGLILTAQPGMVRANGGIVLLVEEAGAYELTVTASPYPLQIGQNDISVLVERLADDQLVLEAEVFLIAEPVDKPGQPQTFSATHARATNKLYYAADAVFPSSGRWKMTVQVAGPEDSVSTAFEVQVNQQPSLGLLVQFGIAAIPIGVVILLLVALHRRAGNKFAADKVTTI